MKEMDTSAGTIRYRETGSGPPILFVHGALVDSHIWDGVAERLSDRFRCIQPDLPLGSHTVPMRPDAELSPPIVAGLLSELVEKLAAGGATIVGNDSGGAISQILVTTAPAGIGRLVLTNCDAFENFPPRRFRYLFNLATVPGGIFGLAQTMRLPLSRRSPLAYGALTEKRIPGELLERWTRPLIDSAEVRRDFVKLIKGASPAQTLKAAEDLPGFERPTLFAWAPEDRFFPLEHAERLAASMPDARVVRIPDAKTFVMLDQPERLAEEIARFAAAQI